MVRRKRKHRYKPRRKPILKNKVFWGGVAFFLNIAFIFYLLFFSEIFKIQEIKITGNQKINKQEIINILSKRTVNSFFGLMTNIFLINSKDTEKEVLRKFSQIDSIKIRKQLPNVINIEIKEKEPAALSCFDVFNGEKCEFLDEKGVVFEKKEDDNFQDLPVIKVGNKKEIVLGDKILEESNLKKILKIRENLEIRQNLKIKEYLFGDKVELNVITLWGFEIYFDLKKDIDEQIFKLNLLFENELSSDVFPRLKYIDLRFSRVYIYPTIIK